MNGMVCMELMFLLKPCMCQCVAHQFQAEEGVCEQEEPSAASSSHCMRCFASALAMVLQLCFCQCAIVFGLLVEREMSLLPIAF